MKLGAVSPRLMLTREAIRARLASTAPAGPRGDLVTAMRLMEQGELPPMKKDMLIMLLLPVFPTHAVQDR